MSLIKQLNGCYLSGRKVLVLAFWDDALQFITKLFAKPLCFMLLFKMSRRGPLKSSKREPQYLFSACFALYIWLPQEHGTAVGSATCHVIACYDRELA